MPVAEDGRFFIVLLAGVGLFVYKYSVVFLFAAVILKLCFSRSDGFR